MAGRHAHASHGRLPTPLKGLAAVAALLCAVALAMAWLWPDGSTPSADTQKAHQVDGVVDALDRQPCPQPVEPQEPSTTPTTPVSTSCGQAQVRLTSGPQAGNTFTVPLPSGVGAPTVVEGDEVTVGYSPESSPASRYAIIDHQRGTQLWVLLAAFAVSVVAFGRWRGVSALFGLGVTFTIIIAFVIPAILDGKPPLAVAIVGCSAIVLVVLYLTHGTGQTTTVALAGTLASLLLTGLLAGLSVTVMRLSGAGDESSFILGQSYAVDLRGLLLAGILIGSLGVLDDVTVTQAVTVDELAQANPEFSARELYAAATRVGRAHIASVINTIVLAYAGASLPLLVLIVALDDPVSDILTDQLVATELVRSAVGTMGLIAAVPITTAAAAVLARRSRGSVGHA